MRLAMPPIEHCRPHLRIQDGLVQALNTHAQ